MTMEKSHLHSVVDQDGAAILDIDRGLISTLNATGAYVWQGLERGEPLETIIANLARETGEDALVIDRDVREFLDSLKQKHLLPR
jgi:6-phosphogluconate dehydrogenase (decarboxylating)